MLPAEVVGRGEKMGGMAGICSQLQELDKSMDAGGAIDVDQFITQTDELLHGLRQADEQLQQRGDNLLADIASTGQLGATASEYDVLIDSIYRPLWDKILKNLTDNKRLSDEQKSRLRGQLTKIDTELNKRYQLR